MTNPKADAYKSVWDAIADTPQQAANLRPAIQGYVNHVLRAAELAPGMTVVDVGTGDGLIAFEAIQRIGASLNVVFGGIVAWVLVRYQFPGKKVIDALVDLPFALPTAVAGIALTSLYSSNGWFGRYLEPMGIKVAFTPLGVIIALTFIGLPFVVRTVQPVLEDAERELEEAAASLGANNWQTFTRIIFPTILPALLTGFALAFARATGEYGSVIFIAGNMPMVSEITPLFIITKLEQYDYAGATAIAVVMLTVSFILLLLINLLQAWARKRGQSEKN